MITHDNGSHQRQTFLNFQAFAEESDSLPFPLNLNIFCRWIISALLVAIFVQGMRLRLKIVSYIRSPDTKLNETNILFCLDQANGLFLAIMISCAIIFLLLTEPAAKVIDPKLCYLNGASQGMYLSGTFIWRCCIAIYRVLFIKGHKWLTDKIGMNSLLTLMIAVGLVLMTGFSMVSVTSDPYSYSKRICNHWSDNAVDIIKTYQVLSYG